MAKKLFVGGLSWGTSDEELRGSFARFGEIEEAKVITDRETGRSRGFGFVTFREDGDALNAVSEMDGQELGGRAVKVNEARERPRESRGGDFNRGGSAGGPRYSSARDEDRGRRW